MFICIVCVFTDEQMVFAHISIAGWLEVICTEITAIKVAGGIELPFSP